MTEPTPADSPAAVPPSRRRLWFGVAALAALAVAVVFTVVGDGVQATADGFAGLVLDHAHALVWFLLAAALGSAAATGRWGRIPGALAVTALIVYVVFILTLITHD